MKPASDTRARPKPFPSDRLTAGEEFTGGRMVE